MLFTNKVILTCYCFWLFFEEIKSDPKSYDYFLFENFALNEVIFRLEMSLIRNFQTMRSNLREEKKVLEHILSEKCLFPISTHPDLREKLKTHIAR
jgi:hypothetical protein